MSTKIFFLLILALALLTLGGLALGWSHDARAAAPSWLETLQDLAAPRHPVITSDLFFFHPEECKTLLEEGRFQFPAGGQCTFYLGASDTPVRTMEMEAEKGIVAVAFTPQEPDRLAVHKTLTPEKPRLRLSIFRQGGELTLTCLPGQPCVLALR